MTVSEPAEHRLALLRPAGKPRVIDLVRAAGLDVADWSNSRRGPQGASTNPKFCYEWVFADGRTTVLSLWHDALSVEAERIVHRANFRDDAAVQVRMGRAAPWGVRARRMDDAVREAWESGRTVCVILNAGLRRDPQAPHARSSSVTARVLDPEPWSVAAYDIGDGAHLLVRGLVQRRFVDQFSSGEPSGSEGTRREAWRSTYVRERAVRDHALRRAGGACEYCGAAGFRCPSGALYLETHHIHPLHEGGRDAPDNLIALCPAHHREAHHGADRDMLRARFTQLVARR
jgi:5-methylcytosine-specific restriction enzyme A